MIPFPPSFPFIQAPSQLGWSGQATSTATGGPITFWMGEEPGESAQQQTTSGIIIILMLVAVIITMIIVMRKLA